jgi:hypothetical protein
MYRSFRALVFTSLMAGSLSAGTILIDTFQGGTTENWFVPGPSPNPPSNQPTGGPAGAGDGYLQLVSTGLPGAGGRLVALNSSQWALNYIAAGITAIRMDVNNQGPEDLSLRLLFEAFPPGPPGPPDHLALSANAISVPAGSGWMTVVFPITPSDLVVDTFGTTVGALTGANTIRIFHNPAATFPGPGNGIPQVAATLGVDNIAAIPEPGTLWLAAGGALVLLSRLRRR